MPKRADTVIPLYCHKCKSHNLSVQSGQTKEKYKGKKRTRVNIRCKSCGNEWQSVHPEALALAKIGDEIAESGAPHPSLD